jgi:hypothetical protein
MRSGFEARGRMRASSFRALGRRAARSRLSPTSVFGVALLWLLCVASPDAHAALLAELAKVMVREEFWHDVVETLERAGLRSEGETDAALKARLLVDEGLQRSSIDAVADMSREVLRNMRSSYLRESTPLGVEASILAQMPGMASNPTVGRMLRDDEAVRDLTKLSVGVLEQLPADIPSSDHARIGKATAAILEHTPKPRFLTWEIELPGRIVVSRRTAGGSVVRVNLVPIVSSALLSAWIDCMFEHSVDNATERKMGLRCPNWLLDSGRGAPRRRTDECPSRRRGSPKPVTHHPATPREAPERRQSPTPSARGTEPRPQATAVGGDTPPPEHVDQP